MDDNQARDEARKAEGGSLLAAGCSLDPAELDERLDEIGRLTSWTLVDRQDAAGGTVLTFDRAAASQVRDLVRRERDCCGHLEFSVEESDECVRVTIRSHSATDLDRGEPAASTSGCGCAICDG